MRLNNLGAYCLGVTEQYAPPALPRRKMFTVLPNHDVAINGQDALTAADQGLLERCAQPAGDRLWRLDAGRILTHLEAGGTLADFVTFLSENAAHAIPDAVTQFLADLEQRTRAVVGVQPASLIEFADAPSAAAVAHDSQAGKYCYLAGERFVAVPAKNERAFRSALKRLGYVW